jgi:hypothetical protein
MTTPEHLDQWIDHYQNGHPVIPQTDEEHLALELMQFAESFTPSHTLDETLVSRFQVRPKHKFPSVATTAAAIFIVLMVGLTLFPLKSYAQAILRQIGTFIITDEDPRTQETAPPHEQPEGYALVPVAGIAEAQALLDFPIHTIPSPLPGYPAYYVLPPDEHHHIVTDYRLGQWVVTLFQWLSNESAPAGVRQVGDAIVQDVTVNGESAVWIEGWWGGESHVFNSLLWEADGFTFSLQTPYLTLDEMIALAESVAPVESH